MTPRQIFAYPLLVLLTSVSWPAIGQTGQPPFRTLMEMAKVKKIIEIDTVAGKTNVLLTSISDNPAFVFVFAPGGDGILEIGARGDGMPGPGTKRGRNPAYFFAPAFLQKQAAWAAIDMPEAFSHTTNLLLSREQRTGQQHIEAFSQVGRRLREEYPKAKLILIGHSNGGITAGMQAVQAKPVFDAIVLSAPGLQALPFGWNPENASVPIMFITHKDDSCKGTEAFRTRQAAGSRFPITVVESPSPGDHYECFNAPAPHFFTDAYVEYADALLKWSASLR